MEPQVSSSYLQNHAKGSVQAWANCTPFVTRPIFTVKSC